MEAQLWTQRVCVVVIMVVVMMVVVMLVVVVVVMLVVVMLVVVMIGGCTEGLRFSPVLFVSLPICVHL